MSDDAAMEREIRSKHDPLELMLREALGSRRTLAFTLRSGKVYIGKLDTNFNPAQRLESIALFLERSGHRSPDTNELTIDVDYEKTHESVRQAVWEAFIAELQEEARADPKATPDQLVERGRQDMTAVRADLAQFKVVVLVSEIVSVSHFDTALYYKYFNADDEKRNITYTYI